MALRLWFSPDLPLSQRQVSYDWKNSQFWDVPIDVGFGSVAEILPQIRGMAASGGKGAVRLSSPPPTQYGQERTSIMLQTMALFVCISCVQQDHSISRSDRTPRIHGSTLRICAATKWCGAATSASMLAYGLGPIGKSIGNLSTAACSNGGKKQYGCPNPLGLSGLPPISSTRSKMILSSPVGETPNGT